MSAEQSNDESRGDAAPAEPPSELDVYPLRERSEDPRWAVWTVWIWVGIASFCLLFILWLVVMGFFYD